MAKRWMVMPRSPEALEKGVATGKGLRSYKGKNAMYISDPAEAREIEQVHHGKDHIITEDQQYSRFVSNDRGEVHNYFFGSNRRYARNWERIFGKKGHE